MTRLRVRTLGIGLLTLGALVAGPLEVRAAGLKKVVAVAEFQNKSNYTGQWAIGDGMADQLTDALIQSDQFTVVERQELGDILKEQDLVTGGRMRKSKSAETGKLVSAQILLVGAITEFQAQSESGGQGFSVGGFSLGKNKSEAHVGLIIRGFDTNSGEVLFSERVEGKAESGGVAFQVNAPLGSYGKDSKTQTPMEKATQVAIDNAVALIASKLEDVPYQGSVIQVKGGDVYISAGERSGASVGDQFGVYGVGEELVDPVTGESLGSEEELLGTVKIVSVSEKFSKARAVGALSGVKTGDLVRVK
jgi:curli biogenesis system outer membrane secretion channel CsgG